MVSVMPRTLIHGEGRLQLSLSKTKMMGGITMTHWQIYNTFERAIFLIGYFAIWYVTVKLLAKMLNAWDKRHTEKRAMQQKTQHSEAIDGTYWVYDCKAEIKRLGHELRELTWENVRKSAE